MAENKMSDIIRASLDGIKAFTEMDTTISGVVTTPSGVTVIPISRVSLGFAGGGLDYGGKKITQAQNFGSGSGTGVSITPIALLTVSPDATVNLVPITQGVSEVERIADIIEGAPTIIEKIKNALS